MNCKDVTFCVKTFNRPETLILCLKHLLKYANGSKIIVCDDSSIKPFKYPKSILKKIKLIKSKFPIGVAKGRNVLVKSVKTKYLFMMDDDHIIIKDWKNMLNSVPIKWLKGIVAFPVYEKKTEYYMGGFKFEKCSIADGDLVYIKATDCPPYDACCTNFLIPTNIAKRVYRDECLKQKGDHFAWHWKLKHVMPSLQINVMSDDYLFLHITTSERYSDDYSKFRNRDVDISEYLKKIGVVRYTWQLQHKKIDAVLPDIDIKESITDTVVTDGSVLMKILAQTISDESSLYKKGFLEEIRSSSVQNAKFLIISTDAYNKIKTKYEK